MASDDGRLLKMPGITFNSIGGQSGFVDVATFGQGTDTIGYGYNTAHRDSRGSFEVTTETTVTLYAMFFQGAFGSSFELAIARGDQTSTQTSQIYNVFALLEDGLFGWKVEALCDDNSALIPERL